MDEHVEKIDTQDEKSNKFRALAEKRTNNALEAVRRIGNLSNRHLYDFEDAQIKKIAKALRDAVTDMEAKFSSPKRRGGPGFKL